MSFLKKISDAVLSWRRRRGVQPSRRRANVAMEQLDHRQLLAVNFTGNVLVDFPATRNPGVVVLPDNPNVQHPDFPPNNLLRDQILVSGFDINGIRLTYDSADDTLNIGIQQPDNQRGTGQMVIAGDADNNGNSGTVNPIISDGQGGGIEPGFQDPADLGASETMAAFFDLNNDGFPDVIAGYPQASVNNTGAKPYQVALAIQDPDPQTGQIEPDTTPQLIRFGAQLPQYTGNVYLVNDPNHPNLEMQIKNFSLLYQQITGQVLTPETNIRIGALGFSDQNIGVSDAYFPPLPANIGQATPPLPPPPEPCPPVSPPIYVNPHQKNHLNTAHNTAIRVTVIGSSGFDPTQIDVSTVRFGSPDNVATSGAVPILAFESNVNRDQFPDETFVFNGLDVDLPPGITTAQIIGTLNDGTTTFVSSVRVFNRDQSFYSDKAINAQQNRFAKFEAQGIEITPVIPAAARRRAATGEVADLVDPLTGRVSQRLPGATGVRNGVKQAARSPEAKTVSLAKNNNKHAKKIVVRGKAAPARAASGMADMQGMQIIGGAS